MRIIVDAFGGDNAPLAVIKGVVAAKKEYKEDIVLVGSEEKIKACASENGIDISDVEIVNADEVIEMCDDPTSVLKKKAGSSMSVGLRMLSEGKGDAFVSAGSTAALVVGATLIVKRLKGVKRPALATVLPGDNKNTMIMDIGANAVCRASMLLQFAAMGSVYMKKIYGVENPSVGLVNIGAEETKGTPLQLETYKLLSESGLNFAGNVEPRDIPSTFCDVVVADGFTGNVILKLTEGVAKMFSGRIKAVFKKNIFSGLAYLLVKGGIADFKKKMDYSEHGGAPLLGVQKPVIKAHGSSDERAIKNAVRQAIGCVKSDMIGKIKEEVAALSHLTEGSEE